VLDALLAHPISSTTPIIIITNNDDTAGRYLDQVSGRLKQSFRKSGLLSSLDQALNQSGEPSAPLGSKILCVDDDPEILLFIARCLEPEGYVVESCNSGEEALKLAATREYGLVLLDIAMPGLDGWETCHLLKSDMALSGIKVYLVTAKPIEAAAGQLAAVDADGYLMKPFHPDDLSQLVNSVSTVSAVRQSDG
jgi:CheY-like chemotaxis protein